VNSPISLPTVFFECPLRRFRGPVAAGSVASVAVVLIAGVWVASVGPRLWRWTSISVLSIRSSAVFIMVRIRPLRSSSVVTCAASSLASCSAWLLRIASIARISVKEEGWVIAIPPP
jgi:hypothetical protein